MKKLKLFAKILLCLLAFLFLVVAALHFALVHFAPLDSVKNKIITTIKEQMFIDAKIGSISASIFDFEVKGLDLDIENQNIAHIDKLYLHFSLIKLLKGQIKVNSISIDELNIVIVKDKNGKFNFDPVFESPMFKKDEQEIKQEKTKKKDEQEQESPVNLLLHSTQLHNCNIAFIDEQNDMSITLSKMSFDMKGFKFDKSFKFDFFTDVYAKINDMTIESLNVAFSGIINLQELDLAKAEIKVSSFILRLKDTVITTKGTISNFNNPNINLFTKILNLCSQSFSEITELPDFQIPEIDIQTSTNINLDNSIVKIEKLDVNVLESTINASGNLNYGKEELEYDINVVINFILDKIHKVSSLINPYNPTGKIQANLNVTNKSSVISGTASLIDVCAFTPQLGNFTAINSQININNINDIKIPELTGKLNKYPFKSSAVYVIEKDKGTIKADFTADRFYGKMDKKYEEEMKKKDEENKIKQEMQEKEAKENTEPKEETKTDFPLPPLDILATVNIKDLDVPFFMGKDINFKMDMKKVTPDLNAVIGTLDLSTDNGVIKDIYKLTESNVVIKGLFLSLKIVSDVINALNVLDILNSIGSAIVSSKEEDTNATEMTEEHAQEQNKKIDGKIDFISFITSINFEHGKGTFNKCSFVSNLLSFKVGGEMNFKDNLLKMTVNAAPGRHEDDGIMPLTMKIGGTMDEPSGSLSLLGSVTTLVGDALMKNVVSSNLKAGFTKLLGLKKHDEQGNDIIESTGTVNTETLKK
jgi:AsmA protein